MSEKSFYDLDYVIETNEKRLKDVEALLQQILSRFTNLILIYSAIAIFLVSIVQDMFWEEMPYRLFQVSFFAFAMLFFYSLVFAIRLLIPENIAYLHYPSRYYGEYRLEYEKTIADKKIIENLLKASYITELEVTLTSNNTVFLKKKGFYNNALMYALLSIIPYLVCLGFHIAKKEDKTYRVEVVKWENNRNLLKIDSMPNNKSKKDTNSTTTTTTTTQLPGVDNSKVIHSSPIMIKENSHTPSKKK